MSDIHPFDDPERLRLLLVDVHYGGDRPWERDPDVAELMALSARKYAGQRSITATQPRPLPPRGMSCGLVQPESPTTPGQ